MKASNIEKYLSRYAEPEAAYIASLQQALSTSEHSQKYQRSLIIPAYDESFDFFTRLKQVNDIEKTLVIIVINQPVQTPESFLNKHLHEHIMASGKRLWQSHTLSFVHSTTFDTIVVDRFSASNAIPVQQGVGLARKIAADIACQCHHYKLTETPWVYSTDADAHLPQQYFSQENNNSVAKVFNFHHIETDSPTSHATQLYEQALKYYCAGLAWAESPYAFYTLGSTLAFKVEAYCTVRGFPKKSGAEDFYLLNKIAKTGNIHQEKTIKILLEPRVSNRVPFGTGPAVKKILELENPNTQFNYYNPLIFDALKYFIAWAQNDLFAQIKKNKPLNIPQDISINSERYKVLPTAIEHIQLPTLVGHAVTQCKDKQAFERHFFHWFDGFKTLKFIHFMEKNGFEPTPLQECLRAQQHWECDSKQK